MKKCWSYLNNDDSKITSAGTVLLGFLCVWSIIQEAAHTKNPGCFVIISITLFATLYTFPALLAFVSQRKYRLEARGITFYYPFGLEVCHDWSDFSEISICKIHYAGRTTKHHVAIRCVVGKEEFGPSCAMMSKSWWSTELYEVIHFRKIYSIYYTEERYLEFVEYCPITIIDYRYLKDTL